MGEQHTEMPQEGTFCWNELTSPDAAACKEFYTGLLGWTTKEMDMGPATYTIFKAGDRDIGGMMQMNKEMCPDAKPGWMAYVAVADVDARARRVEELGGKVCVPPTDIPTVGRFCVITDPAGTALSLITLTPPAQSASH